MYIAHGDILSDGSHISHMYNTKWILDLGHFLDQSLHGILLELLLVGTMVESETDSVVGSDLVGVADSAPGTEADFDSECSATGEYGQTTISRSTEDNFRCYDHWLHIKYIVHGDILSDSARIFHMYNTGWIPDLGHFLNQILHHDP